MWIPSDLNQDISHISLENIRFLKEKGIREGVNLEFKERYTKNLESTICAFMNTEGGWLIIGVKEEDEKITEIIGIEKDFIENFRKSFDKYDPYPSWNYEEHLKELKLENGKKLYILRIPKNEHSIKLSGLSYIRVGSETIKLIRETDIIELKKRKGEYDVLGREILRYRKIPKKDYSGFVGREEVYRQILKELKGHHYIISIDGIGGVGKSTLALEIAHNAFEQRIFDSVLWFSAKKEKFIYSQITSIDPEFTSLDDLLEKIAYELKIANYDKFSIEQKNLVIIQMLKENSFLIILDNLETIDLTINFIEFLARVEGKSKVLITSRKRIGQIERILTLDAFSLDDTVEFVNMEADSRSYLMNEPKEEIYNKIYELTEGIPLAIKVILGWLVKGVTLSIFKEKIRSPDIGILDFCFKETYENLLSDEAKEVFCIFSVLPNSINDEELSACFDYDKDKIMEIINALITFSLISFESEKDEEEKNNYYKMLPLTQLYANQKLKDFKNLERNTLKKYNNFIEKRRQFQFDLKSLTPEKKMVGLNEKQKKAYIKALKASEAFDRGNYALSLKLFQEAEKAADDVAEIYFIWARIEMSLGHLRKTDELFTRLTSLEPKNATYWLTWASSHRRINKYSRAIRILNNALKNISSDDKFLVKRELAINFCYSKNFKQSLSILENNLTKKKGKSKYKFLNTKTMRSILHTYILQALDFRRIKKNTKKAIDTLKKGLKYYKDNKSLVDLNLNDSGIIWRLKRIYLALANLSIKRNFAQANEYFKKAYYEDPQDDREQEQNFRYFLRDWQYFKKYWTRRGKKNDDFIDIYKDDPKGNRFSEDPGILLKKNNHNYRT